MRAVCALGDPRPHPQRTARRRCVRTQEDAERAIQTMNGMVVGQWRVRCGWANHKQARPQGWAQPLGTARLLGVRRSMCRHEAAARSLQAWCAAGACGVASAARCICGPDRSRALAGAPACAPRARVACEAHGVCYTCQGTGLLTWAGGAQETVGDMDAASVDKADPTNANVYVGNLSAEVRVPAARPCALLLRRRQAGVSRVPVAAPRRRPVPYHLYCERMHLCRCPTSTPAGLASVRALCFSFRHGAARALLASSDWEAQRLAAPRLKWAAAVSSVCLQRR